MIVFVFLKQVSPLTSLSNLIEKSDLISKKQVIKKRASKKAKISYLVMNLPEKSSKEKTANLFLVVVDFNKRRINSISIPGETFLNIPGYGFEKIGKLAAKDDIATIIATMDNLLGIHIDHYVKSKNKSYGKFIDVKNFIRIMTEATGTDMTLKENTSLLKFLSGINISDIKIDSLPVKTLFMNGTTYYEPKKEELNELILKIYGVENKLSKEKVRVIVLNGSGMPGVAGEVSKKLIDSGYKIVDNRNADSFKYANTQIISFKMDVSEAIRIKKLLGLGTIIRKNSPQDIADIAIVIGKDYQNQ
jgi:anionic cell wall polymer biosynthesis LytR-Cps2A-Psr (LCP) family protein